MPDNSRIFAVGAALFCAALIVLIISSGLEYKECISYRSEFSLLQQVGAVHVPVYSSVCEKYVP